MIKPPYVDLDGVIFDFDSEYTRLTGHKWDLSREYTPAEKKAKWDALKPFPDFFRNLPLMPGALELWAFLEPLGAVILTAVSSKAGRGGHLQKVDACAEHLKIGPERVIVVQNRRYKKNYAEPGRILIDDRMDVILEWQEAGGIGVHFRNAAQTILDLKIIIGFIEAEQDVPEIRALNFPVWEQQAASERKDMHTGEIGTMSIQDPNVHLTSNQARSIATLLIDYVELLHQQADKDVQKKVEWLTHYVHILDTQRVSTIPA